MLLLAALGSQAGARGGPIWVARARGGGRPPAPPATWLRYFVRRRYSTKRTKLLNELGSKVPARRPTFWLTLTKRPMTSQSLPVQPPLANPPRKKRPKAP